MRENENQQSDGEASDASTCSIGFKKTDEWDDNMNPRGKVVEVWKLWTDEPESAGVDMRTDRDILRSKKSGDGYEWERHDCSMDDLRDAIINLANNGSSTGFGYRAPLEVDQMYGITMRDNPPTEYFPWIAYVKAFPSNVKNNRHTGCPSLPCRTFKLRRSTMKPKTII